MYCTQFPNLSTQDILIKNIVNKTRKSKEIDLYSPIKILKRLRIQNFDGIYWIEIFGKDLIPLYSRKIIDLLILTVCQPI